MYFMLGSESIKRLFVEVNVPVRSTVFIYPLLILKETKTEVIVNLAEINTQSFSYQIQGIETLTDEVDEDKTIALFTVSQNTLQY